MGTRYCYSYEGTRYCYKDVRVEDLNRFVTVPGSRIK